MTHAAPDSERSLWMSAALAVRGGAVALGYGCTLGRFLRIRPNSGDAGILGLFCLGTLGLVLHFFTPLSAAVKVTVLCVGLILAGMQWRQIREGFALHVWTLMLICAVMLIHAQALPQFQSDMGGYHLQALRWDREYPIVLGLGNLHGRLAFNSVVILMTALLDDVGTRWIVNVLVAVFFWVSVFIRLKEFQSFRASKGTDQRANIEYWFLILVLAGTALVPKLWGETWAINADIVTAYLIMYWVVLALGYQRSDRGTTAAILILASSLAVTSKVSAAPLLVVTVVFLAVYRRFDRRSVLRAAALAVILLVAWTSRSVLLSGCAIYPLRQSCAFGIPWAESPEMVYDEAIAIRSWARLEGEGHFAKAAHGWNWLNTWVKSNRRQTLPLVFLLGVLVGSVALLLDRSVREGLSADVKIISAGLAACLTFWFMSAPDVRFAAGSLVSVALLGGGIACAAVVRMPRLYSQGAKILIALLVVGGLTGLRIIASRPDFNRFRIPDVAVYSVDTGGGRSVWVPVGDNSCWDHPLPCTPFVDPAGIARVRNRDAFLPADASLAPPPGWKPQASVNPFPAERDYRDLYSNRGK